MLVCYLPSKSRTKLAQGVMYASTTHVGLVHNVTYLVKMAANTAVCLRLQNVLFKKARP